MKQDLVFKYFTEICQIPHTSGNEGAIREYLLDVLQKNGVETYVDPIGNVYGKKHGNIKTSILYQAHMDMVGAKTTDSTHDFLKDPIKYQCIDNKIIKAEKTTLGADNGIGVAMILAMVCDDLTKDFDFEILLTVEEETTTIGAANIQENYFTSKYLINLDSEEEDTITIGSASSCKVVIDIPITRKDLNQKKYLFKIFDGISGHSGATIHEKRANCIVEIFNILKELLKKYKINLVTAKAGEVVNAIPGSCEVIFSTNDDINAIIKDVKEIFTIFKKAYEEFEPNLNFNISEVDDYEVVDINDKSTLDVVNFIVAANNGLNTYSFEQKMTTSSTNLGILYVLENVVTLMWLNRSSYKYLDKKLNNKLIAISELASVNITIDEQKTLPGLSPLMNNKLALLIKDVAKEKFNKEMNVSSIHAGLEFGYIVNKYPNMIPVSIGPNMYEVHTPNEYVEIDSIFYIYKLLIEVMKHI